MPYLQLDTSAHPSPEARRRLASELAACYAARMQMDIRRISVAVRCLGEHGLFRIIDGEAVPAHLLMCDIRRGRDADTRQELARALIGICAEVLSLDPQRVNLEFTQHAPDEMYHPALGGFSPEWSPQDDEPAR